jgi:hypothetical protein
MKKLVLVAVIGAGVSVGHSTEEEQFSPGGDGNTRAGGACVSSCEGRALNMDDSEDDFSMHSTSSRDFDACSCCGLDIPEFLSDLSAKFRIYKARFAGAVKCISELASMLREVQRVVNVVTGGRRNDSGYTYSGRYGNRDCVADREVQVETDDICAQILAFVNKELEDCEPNGDIPLSLPDGFPCRDLNIEPDTELVIWMLQNIEEIVEGAEAAEAPTNLSA